MGAFRSKALWQGCRSWENAHELQCGERQRRRGVIVAPDLPSFLSTYLPIHPSIYLLSLYHNKFRHTCRSEATTRRDIRVFLQEPLVAMEGAAVDFTLEQAHYLRKVNISILM